MFDGRFLGVVRSSSSSAAGSASAPAPAESDAASRPAAFTPAPQPADLFAAFDGLTTTVAFSASSSSTSPSESSVFPAPPEPAAPPGPLAPPPRQTLPLTPFNVRRAITDVAGDLTCPMSQRILRQPVLLTDGRSYEASYAGAYLRGGARISPFDRRQITFGFTPDLSVFYLQKRFAPASSAASANNSSESSAADRPPAAWASACSHGSDEAAGLRAVGASSSGPEPSDDAMAEPWAWAPLLAPCYCPLTGQLLRPGTTAVGLDGFAYHASIFTEAQTREAAVRLSSEAEGQRFPTPLRDPSVSPSAPTQRRLAPHRAIEWVVETLQRTLQLPSQLPSAVLAQTHEALMIHAAARREQLRAATQISLKRDRVEVPCRAWGHVMQALASANRTWLAPVPVVLSALFVRTLFAGRDGEDLLLGHLTLLSGPGLLAWAGHKAADRYFPRTSRGHAIWWTSQVAAMLGRIYLIARDPLVVVWAFIGAYVGALRRAPFATRESENFLNLDSLCCVGVFVYWLTLMGERPAYA